VAAIVVALVHRSLDDAPWLMLHLVFLGALTHSILVWSTHFASTLLKAPEPPGQNVRLAILTVGSAMVLVGVPTTWWPLTLAGGVLVAGAVGWHGVMLLRMLRRALPARFRISVRYYVAAASCLVIGAGFGVTLAWGWDDTWHGRLLVAHALTNVLGWLGLTITGTLLTLWPTMLRARMDDAHDAWTRRALPVLGAAIAVTIGGALIGQPRLAALGLGAYLVGLVIWGRGLVKPLRARPLSEFAPASVGVSLVWLVIGLVWAGWVLVVSRDWATVRRDFIWPAAALASGFGVQLLTGALSYLLPSVLGGGPSVVRAGQRWFNAGGGFRLVAINGGLILWFAPTPSWVKVTGSLLALVAASAFLPIMILGIRASVRARRELLAQVGVPAGGGAGSSEGTPSAPVPPAAGPVAQTVPAGAPARPALPLEGKPSADGPSASGRQSGPVLPRPKTFSAGQLIAGLTAVVTAAVLGIGIDPGAVGASASGTGVAVAATGKTVRIAVEARGMSYVPNSVTVAAGDRLIVDFKNADTTTHDLVIGSARTPRIAPGATAELDAGVISASVQGYCSVVGHRQMGMLFDVTVTGVPAATASPTASGMAGHPMAGPSASASPASLSDVIDPALPPLTDERVHRVTLTVQEVNLEVAPGVWQRRWTFNGRAPGPTLHGRVGDVFEVTLVNSGSMGHSIDFHAGSLAPDVPMRTIEPGESLLYRFTATKAGIWMYHCSTMPMSAHIAAGMFGAVVIEPDGLPAVDRSYVLVQSEAYLSNAASSADGAEEVNADAVSAENPSYVSFNGVAFGYDQQPLVARVGERVRFWVLDAGPNRSSSFHVVGAQFDTVFLEGSYLLKQGRDAFGDSSGGSQALGLQAAQGGFVETVFPEAGRYPLVSHSMVDAERGAHGFVVVS